MSSKGKQMLAVWGSPNSGKTIAAIKLAKELSSKKKNVLLILCDDICPALPTIYKSKEPIEASIGDVLAASNITQEVILKNCVAINSNPYLSLLGYKACENPYFYAEYGKDRAVDFFVLLRHIVDYVVIDCSSILTESVLSTVALEVADNVLRLGGCDLKSISYFMSMLPLLGEQKFKSDSHIKVLSNAKPMQDIEEYKNAYGGISHILPYVQDIEEQAASLTLFDEIKGKSAKDFDYSIKAIVKEVFRNE